MTADFREEILTLYSKASVEDVQLGADYRKLCAKYGNDVRTKRGFFGVLQKIEELRTRIDDWLGGAASISQQVEMALRLLWKLRGSALEGEYARLVLASYGDLWSSEQCLYFQKWAKFFVEASPYFLSFTSRNEAYPEVNQVNRNHRYFIEDALGKGSFENPEELGAENLLARAIHHHLVNRRPGGFFFPQHEGDNQKVKQKLLTALETSFALVQLVQEELFRLHEPERNWCQLEYDVISEHSPERVLFVQIDPVIDYDQVHVDFDDWYRHFAEKDPIKLSWTRWGEEVSSVETNFKKIREELVEQIDQVRDQVYLGVP